MRVLPILGNYQNKTTNAKPSFKGQSPLQKQAKIVNNILSQDLLIQNNCPKQVEQAFINCTQFISDASADTIESFCRLALGKKGSKTIKKVSEKNQIIQNFLSVIENKIGKNIIELFK